MLKKNNKGGITIETIIVLVIILVAGAISLYYFNDKLIDSKDELTNNMKKKYQDKNLVVKIQENTNMNNIDDNDNINSNDGSDILLGEEENDNYEIINLSFNLNPSEFQEQTAIITLEGLKEIGTIKASNSGQVEILKIDGDDVTIKISGGDVKERIVVSGQYIAAQTKFINKQTNPNYNDANGYVGTLTRYLDSYEPAYTKAITMSPTNLTNNFPATIAYTENHVTTTLSKSGASISKVIQGSPSETKTVTLQPNANYSEMITNDNGITTTYTGTLSQYIYSGEAPVSKISTINQSNTTNSFPATITYQDGNYSGTLSKSGNVTSVITKGSASVSKTVDNQSTKNYNETVLNDNGVSTAYTGTLIQYVYQGSDVSTKQIANSIISDKNNFPTTSSYTETVNDNGVSTTFKGDLNKSGNVIETLVKGSVSQSKNVELKDNVNYSETINDNGVQTAYTGALTAYVVQGSNKATKTITNNQKNTTNSFNVTIPYQESISDNGVTTAYTGTLSKDGNVTSVITKGSANASKFVTGQSNANYNETVSDNGISTTYTGTLIAYVNKGSDKTTKTGTSSQISVTNSFPTTVVYNEKISNDNGVVTSYTGTLNKNGNVISVITKGSASVSKTVTGQTSSTYNEVVSNDNGIATAYKGTLSAYVNKGSASASKTVTNSKLNTTGTFDNMIPYSETVSNDNGVSTAYTGNLSKNGTMTSVLLKGSTSATKNVTGQTSVNYNEVVSNDNGVVTAYTGTLISYVTKGSAQKTKTVSKTDVSDYNWFDLELWNTSYYSETVSDNGVTTAYTGVLTKDGATIKNTIKGSESKSKTITKTEVQTPGEFNFYWFWDTNSYEEIIVDDNGVSTKYSGVLTKDGDVISKVLKGSDSKTKIVSGQPYAYYYEEVKDDNGVKTYYGGQLPTMSISKGSDTKTKNVSTTQTYKGFKFDFDTHSYYETVTNDNGVKTAYTGTLTKDGALTSKVLEGSASKTKTVSNQSSEYYHEKIANDNGVSTYYQGTLTTKKLVKGSAGVTKSYTDTRTSEYYDGFIDFNFYYKDIDDNGVASYWMGNLSKSGTPTYGVIKGSAKATKTTTYTLSNVASYNNTYSYSETVSNDNGVSTKYTGSLTVSTATKTTSGKYNVTYKGTVTKPDTRVYGYTQKYTGDIFKPDTRVYVYSGTVTKPDTRYYEYTQKYSGTVSKPDTRQYVYSGTVTKPDTRQYEHTQKYSGIVTKPDTRVYNYTQKYTGTVTKPDTREYLYKGTVTKPDTRQYEYTQNYSGTVTKPDTREYLYNGTVTKPDTRIYNYTQNYSGTVTKPDTREYLYSGTVTKPDTRQYEYTQKYSGTVIKPDTRVYKYKGTVTKPDTRVYSYEQKYRGMVTKPDTRIYKYKGTVTKPDTRQYNYTQTYTGTIYTPDTRMYKYQGTVTKPDTRVYEYTQNYSGILNVPEKSIYMYQGEVIKPASDTRIFKNLYEYEINASYYY